MSGNVKEWVITTTTSTARVRDARRRLQHASFTVGTHDQRARLAV
jgi:hypothetical protein